MKNLFLTAILATAFSANATFAQPAKASNSPLKVAFVIYPEVEVLDLSGPLDVFVKANDISPGSFTTFTVGLDHKPVQTQSGGLTITPQFSLADAPRPDIVVIPGASTKRVSQVGTDKRLQSWLRRNASPNQTIMSVCTGAFIVGHAGLFDGKKSTTHWLTLSEFQTKFPKTQAYSGVRYIEDGNRLSAAGVSSGIDGALHLVEQTRGKRVADGIARAIQYRRETPVYPDLPKERVKLTKTAPNPRGNQKLALDYDPVCHMKVKSDSTIIATFKGKFYGFCAVGCRDAFNAHPEQFIKSK
ncbi:YHS domain-containing protein [bacterium]|nr:MAG: YHS domain-containing protein [bacterium]